MAVFWRTPSAVVGAALLLLVIAVAASAGSISPYGPLEMVAEPFLRPGEDMDFPLGTDMLGRDILTGIFYGARISLFIGGLATAVSLVIGVTIGALSGYYGRWPDRVLMRITELFQTVPSFLFAVTLVAIFQPSIVSIVLAIGVTAWPQLARLVRAEVLKVRKSELVQAEISIGASDFRIIVLHILPNVIAPVVVSASIMAATAILTESSLAFLNMGDANVVSWGGMVGQGREVLRTDWYIAAIPGIAIMITVLALNLLGDGINDILDPRSQRR